MGFMRRILTGGTGFGWNDARWRGAAGLGGVVLGSLAGHSPLIMRAGDLVCVSDLIMDAIVELRCDVVRC